MAKKSSGNKAVEKKEPNNKVVEVEITKDSKVERSLNVETYTSVIDDNSVKIYNQFLNKWSHDQNLQNVVNEVMLSNELVWTEKLLKAIDISYNLTMKYDRKGVYNTFRMFLEKFIEVGVE